MITLLLVFINFMGWLFTGSFIIDHISTANLDKLALTFVIEFAVEFLILGLIAVIGEEGDD